MQPRHPAVGNEPDKNVAQFLQIGLFPLAHLQAMAHSLRSESFKSSRVDSIGSLKIANADLRQGLAIHYAGGLCSDWKLRVISRAPLSKVRYAHAH